jgi:hypothetical protein
MSQQFAEGQRVRVTYERRGFGPVLRRLRVIEMKPA